MTPWQQHVEDWSGCTKCRLHEFRTKTCLGRGKLPCDMFLCGQAPGESEDVLGYPFAGPAGQLMNKWLKAAFDGTSYTWFLSNLVLCFPKQDKDEIGNEEPPKVAIEACTPRLREIIGMAKPKVVVAVGQLSKKWLERKGSPSEGIPLVHIVHPASLLKGTMNEIQRDFSARKAVIALKGALEGLQC